MTNEQMKMIVRKAIELASAREVSGNSTDRFARTLDFWPTATFAERASTMANLLALDAGADVSDRATCAVNAERAALRERQVWGVDNEFYDGSAFAARLAAALGDH